MEVFEQHRRETILRGLRTSWEESGPKHKTILLFLHGYPDSPEIWSYQISHFSKHYQVICPYMRGVYPSETSDSVERYGLDAISMDLLQILEVVDPNKTRDILCVGHDLGAVHAWHLSQFLGKRLKKLVILNGLSIQQAAHRLSDLRQQVRSWYMYLFQIPILPDLLLKNFPTFFSDLAYQLGGLKKENRPKEHVKQDVVSAPMNQYRAFFRSVPEILKRKFHKLPCPVLVLWGKDDPFAYSPTVLEFEPLADDVTVRILEGSHWFYREKPEEINQLMDQFLNNTKGEEHGHGVDS